MDHMNSYLATIIYTQSKIFHNLCQNPKEIIIINLPAVNFSTITMKMTVVMGIYFNSILLKKPHKIWKKWKPHPTASDRAVKSYPCWNFLTMPAEIAEGMAPTQLK